RKTSSSTAPPANAWSKACCSRAASSRCTRAKKSATGSASALYAENIAWHPNGALAGMRYGNGIVHQGVLNARMLPSQLKDGTASELLYQY
ncbi:hypothetical protein RA265_28310, partial [Pseudomonas syringae pv. tagetis]|uniref:hypothetical protein n=1 Tax=Pseudomonas syringae group genomosp. 7 TaxID=251699 RepID=UPI0037705471